MIGNIWIFIIVGLAYSEYCEEVLTNFYESDIEPRILSYQKNGTGFDYLEPPSICRSRNHALYTVIFWKKYSRNIPLMGFCTPEQCKSEEVIEVINSLELPNMEYDGVLVKNYSLTTKSYSNASTFFLTCFSLLIGIGVISTLIPGLGRRYYYLRYFNYVENAKILLNLEDKFGNLGFVDGIRSICSVKIMFLHTMFFYGWRSLSNRKFLMEHATSFSIHILYLLTYSVDIFFFISGCLVVMLTLKEHQNKGVKSNFVICIIQRLLRLIPAYYFILGFESISPQDFPNSIESIFSYTASEPNRPYKWRNYFLIQNIYRTDLFPFIIWIWTVSSDFFYYIISLVILYAYQKSEVKGYLLALAVILSSTLFSFITSQINSYIPSLSATVFNDDQSLTLYFNAFTRVVPYTIGNICGFLLFSRKQEKTESEKNSFFVSLHQKFNIFIRSDSLSRIILPCMLFTASYISLVPYFLMYYINKDELQILKSFWLFSSTCIFLVFSFRIFSLSSRKI